MGLPFAVGDRVAIEGVGAGTIHSVDDRGVHLIAPGESEPTITVQPSAACTSLRALIGRPEAEALLALLTKPLPRGYERRCPPLRSSRQARALSHDERLEMLRIRHRAPRRLLPHEEVYLDAVLQPLVSELALVFGVPTSRVLAGIRKGDSSLELPAPKPLPSPAPLDLEGAQFLRSFWLGRRALVGSLPHDPEEAPCAVGTEPGAWHAYRLDTTTDDMVDPALRVPPPIDGMLALHHDWSGPVDVSTLSVRAAAWDNPTQDLAILDVDALKDPDLGPTVLAAMRDELDHYGDRGACTWIWADGECVVLVDAKPRAKLILVKRVFR